MNVQKSDVTIVDRRGALGTGLIGALAVLTGCAADRKIDVKPFEGLTTLSANELEQGISRSVLTTRLAAFRQVIAHSDTVEGSLQSLLDGVRQEGRAWFLNHEAEWGKTRSALRAFCDQIYLLYEGPHVAGIQRSAARLWNRGQQLVTTLNPAGDAWLRSFKGTNPSDTEGTAAIHAFRGDLKAVVDVIRHDVAQLQPLLGKRVEQTDKGTQTEGSTESAALDTMREGRVMQDRIMFMYLAYQASGSSASPTPYPVGHGFRPSGGGFSPGGGAAPYVPRSGGGGGSGGLVTGRTSGSGSGGSSSRSGSSSGSSSSSSYSSSSSSRSFGGSSMSSSSSGMRSGGGSSGSSRGGGGS